MVSKLVFKGDKKKKKKSKRSRDDEDSTSSSKKFRNEPITVQEEEEGEVNTIGVNNKFLRIDELNVDTLDAGWTSAITTRDLNGPIMITKQFINTKTEEESIGALIFNSLQQASVSHDLSVVDESQNIIYTPDYPDIKVNTESKIQRIEPTDTNQVYVIMDIGNLLKETLRKNDTESTTSKSLVLKNSEGMYLSYDVSEEKLGLSEVITPNEIFEFRLQASPEKGYQWMIYLNDGKMKLKMDKEFKVKIVPNIENDKVEDNDEFSFIIRIQLQNSEFTKRCITYHTSQFDNARESDEILNSSIKKLMSDKISITNSIMKRLQKAVSQGNVNEVLIDIKEKHRSDSRC